MKPDLSVIIPVYNESDNVDLVYKAIDDYAAAVDTRLEFVFVDDGSADDSVALLRQLTFHHAQVKVITLSKNFGAHVALRAGFKNASADNCICYFMDMQEPIGIISDLYRILQDGYDFAYEIRKSYRPSFFSRWFTSLVRKMIAPDYPEKGIGCFAFNGKIKDCLNKNMESHSSIHLQLFTMGFRKKGVEYDIVERAVGQSKWSTSKKVKAFIDTFVAFSYSPLRFVSLLGIVLAVIGFIWALGIFAIKVFNLMPLQAGYPTLISIILIGFGVTNISIGVISEYLWRTLDIARNRPLYIIDEVIELSELSS